MEENGELECLLCDETFPYGLDHNCGTDDNVQLKTEPIPQEAPDLKNSDDQLVRDKQTLTSSVHIKESMDEATFPNIVDHCGKDNDAHFMFQPISQEDSANSNDKYDRGNKTVISSDQSNESIIGTVSPCCVDHNYGKDDIVQSKLQQISQEVCDIKGISNDQLNHDNQPLTSSVHIYKSMDGSNFPYGVDHHCEKDKDTDLIFQPISQETSKNSHDQFNRDNQPLISNVHINESMDEAILPYSINYEGMCDNIHLIFEPISQEVPDNNGDQLNSYNQPLTSYTDSITGLSGVSSKDSHKNFSGSHCGREYRDNYDPQEHYRFQTIEKPFGCKEFGTRLCMRSNMNGHCPFVCKGCGTRFIHRSYLQHHLRLHKGIRPFVCRGCGSEFSLLCGLNTHLLSCLNINTACDYTEKRFNLEHNCLRQDVSHVGSRSMHVSLNNAYHFEGPLGINNEPQMHPEVGDFSYPVRRKGISLRDNFVSNY